MRGDKNQRTVQWWAIGTLPVALLVSSIAKDHGAPFWMQLVVVTAEAAVLGILIGLVLRAAHRRRGH
jgi:hypothetical protein